jgi:beta-1,4-N-acetylglucosaminyltransferase
MILVTVGTHPQGFERLVRAADELAGELDEHMVIQSGSSKYVPQYAEHFSFVTSQHMESLIHDARVVVAHAAAGTALLVLQQYRPLVLVPRSKAHHEAVDDHQLQLARALQETGRAITVTEPDALTLRAGIAQSECLTGQPGTSNQPLICAVAQQMGEWAKFNQRTSP